jgi:hypothetical protein
MQTSRNAIILIGFYQNVEELALRHVIAGNEDNRPKGAH